MVLTLVPCFPVNAGERFCYSYYQDHANCFSINLLDITNNISISAASFQSRADVYNQNSYQTDLERLTSCLSFGMIQNIHGKLFPFINLLNEIDLHVNKSFQ